MIGEGTPEVPVICEGLVLHGPAFFAYLTDWLSQGQDSSSCASPSLKFSLCTPTPTPCKLLLGGAWPLELLPCLPRWYRSLFYPVLISLTFLASQAGSLSSESFGVILNCVWFSVIFSLLLEGSNQTFFFFLLPIVSAELKAEAIELTFYVDFA